MGTIVRVEVKSSKLIFNRRDGWLVHFAAVKQELFDELRLVFYTPWGIGIVLWDGRTGLSTHGARTNVLGSQIQFYGPRKEHDPHKALNVMLSKKLGDCE